MARMEIALADASLIANAIVGAAERQGYSIALAIVDPSGWSLLQLRMDNVFLAAVDAALAKARTAALYRRASSEFSKRVKEGMPLAHLPHVVPLGGGVLLKRNGDIVGALGLSGSQEDEETELAEKIAAAYSIGALDLGEQSRSHPFEGF